MHRVGLYMQDASPPNPDMTGTDNPVANLTYKRAYRKKENSTPLSGESFSHEGEYYQGLTYLVSLKELTADEKLHINNLVEANSDSHVLIAEKVGWSYHHHLYVRIDNNNFQQMVLGWLLY